ncbi:MAG: cytidine deaminase [Streptosporangiales bacterium]|nr:cytidine deaminase [Streptosporangiales bacterium]
MTEQLADPEDAKLATLARAALGRASAAEGAAVRDDIGRTYVGTAVQLPTLQLTALQVAVVQAVSSGAQALEAAVVVTDAPNVDDRVVRDLSADAPVHVVRP